jgi:MoxR-like ATPase
MERNEALAEGVKRVASSARPEAPAGVLVAGGFHTEGITQSLQKKGLNVLVLAPKIKAINGEHYMAAFSRDRSPLDRILVGEKLFLAAPQTIGAGPNTVPPSVTAEALGRNNYFMGLVDALGHWVEGQAEVVLNGTQKLHVFMGERAKVLSKKLKGYVQVDGGDQFVVMAQRATALAFAVSLAFSVVNAHWNGWNRQNDVIQSVASRVVKTSLAVRPKKTEPTSADLPTLLSNSFLFRYDLMKALDLGQREEAYRLYNELSSLANPLSELCRTQTQEQFNEIWRRTFPKMAITDSPEEKESLRLIRLELIEEGLSAFPAEFQARLDALIEQTAEGFFPGDSSKQEFIRDRLKKSLTPGHFTVSFPREILDEYFRVADLYSSTKDPAQGQVLSAIAQEIRKCLDPLSVVWSLGTTIAVGEGKLTLKTFLSEDQIGHVFVHEVVHLGGFQGWLKIPYRAEHFPHANQILYLYQEKGVDYLDNPALLAEMGVPVKKLFDRGFVLGEGGDLGFLILTGASGENYNYFSNTPLLNEAAGVMALTGEKDLLLTPYMAQRATGIVLAGVLAGRASKEPDFNPRATMRGLYESLHDRLGPPTEDESRYLKETVQFLSQVAKGLAGASVVKMVPKLEGGAWTAHTSKDYICQINYVPSDLYPRGPGSIQEEKEKVRARGLAHTLWAVEGPRHEKNDLRDQSPLLKSPGFEPKLTAFHALWKALLLREMVAGLTEWNDRGVQTFSQMADMAGAPQWMHELFQHRYHSGNEDYDRLLLSSLTSSEQFLDVLMYLRVHYQGGEVSLNDPRLMNPRVHAALTEALGSMTREGESGWGRVLFEDNFISSSDFHPAIAKRIWPAFNKLFEEDVHQKMLQKAYAKMLQDRQQELNEQQREAFRKAILENLDNEQRKELEEFLKNLKPEEKQQIRQQAQEEMNQQMGQFADSMQQKLLGEKSNQPSGEGQGQSQGQGQSPGEGQGGERPASPSDGQGSPRGTETRGLSSSSSTSPASLKESIQKLAQNLATLEKQLSDLGQKAQGLGEEAQGVGKSAASPTITDQGESLKADGKAIQEGVHGLQQEGRKLAQGVEEAQEKAAQDAAGLPVPGTAKPVGDALADAREQSDELLGKLQEIQQKANDLARLTHRLSETLGSDDATLPGDQAAALQKAAQNLEKSLNEVGRKGPAHELEKALQNAQQAVQNIEKLINSKPSGTKPSATPSKGASRQQPSGSQEEPGGDAPGTPQASGGERTGDGNLKPFELDAPPNSSSLWEKSPETPSGSVKPKTGATPFQGFRPEDYVDIKTVFPGLTAEESEEYRQFRAPHQALIDEVASIVPQLLHWKEGAEIRGEKYHGLLTDIVGALTTGAGRSLVEPSKPRALNFTVLVDRSGSMDDKQKQEAVQFLLLLMAEVAFALQKSVPRGPEFRDTFQFTIGFFDTEETRLITHKTSGQLRSEGISKESVIYKLLKSAEAQSGTDLANNLKKYHADLSQHKLRRRQGDSPARKILIVTSDMEVGQNQFNSMTKTLEGNVLEKDSSQKVLTILVPTGENEYSNQLKQSVGNRAIVLDAKPYGDLYRNILTVFAAGLNPDVAVSPEAIQRIGLDALQRRLLPRAMSGWLRSVYNPLIQRGWHKSAALVAGLLESGPAVALGNLLGFGWISHSIYFILIHLGKPLTKWARDARGEKILSPETTPLTLNRWPLILLYGFLGAAFHVWGVDLILQWVGPFLWPILTSSEFLPFTQAGIAVLLHSVYNLLTPGYLGMAGANGDVPFGDYKNFYIRKKGGLDYLVYKNDTEELEWQRAPDPTRPGVTVPQKPIESIPDNEETLKEIIKRNFINGAIYMMKSEDGRRWFRPGSGSEMEYWEQDEKDEWRQKETFSRDKTPTLVRRGDDGRNQFRNGDSSLAWSWISEQPETLRIQENGGTDQPVTGWSGETPRTLELKRISDDVILAFSADELKPSLFRLVRHADGWRVEEKFLLDFIERRENFVGLIGPTGVGKEKFSMAFGHLMNLPVDIISGHDKMQADELLYETHIGRPEAGRQTEKPSVISRALYHGGIAVLDEEKMMRSPPKDALLPIIANGTVVLDRRTQPVYQNPWGRFMTTANFDQENIGTATTGEKAKAWLSRQDLLAIAPARPEQEAVWQQAKAKNRFRKSLPVALQKTIGDLVNVATLMRLKVWGFHPQAQAPIITQQEDGVSIHWRQTLLGEGGARMVPSLTASERLSRAPSPRVVEHMAHHFAAFPMDYAHRKWSVVRRYFNFDADDAPPGEYETQVKVQFERIGFKDEQPEEAPLLARTSFEYDSRGDRHFLRLVPRLPAGDPDPRWDPVELEIYEGSWLLTGAFDRDMERWIKTPENSLRIYKALQGWSLGLPLLFIGEPSSGKSHLAGLLQNLVGGGRHQISANKETMPHNLFYEKVIGPVGDPAFVTVMKPRPILEAGLTGGSCIIDEAHFLSQTMQGAFNNALSSGFYNLDGKLYRMPYLIFAMNEPDEDYAALNAAFEERMDSQRFLPLPPEKVKEQIPVIEIRGETFNDRLIAELELNEQGQPVLKEGRPHFLGLVGVMDYIRHHSGDFPRLFYFREFSRLVLGLARNEAGDLESLLRQISAGQQPRVLPQRKLFEIIRAGCRWPEGSPDQMAKWDEALQKAMADAGLWNDLAESDPSQDGLLLFLNGEGLFIKDYPLLYTPDLGDLAPKPILEGLLFLQRRTRGTRVDGEMARLSDHLQSLQSRWASLPFPERMAEVHVLREIHTTLGKVVDSRRGQHLPGVVIEMERLQAGIRAFLFSESVDWPSNSLDPTVKREAWLQRHSLGTPGNFVLDDLLGKTQVFPGDPTKASQWIEQASSILMEAAQAGTRIILNAVNKGDLKDLPELAEVYLEPLESLEKSLRVAPDAVPDLADTVAQLQRDIRSAIEERRNRTSLIDDLADRLAKLKVASTPQSVENPSDRIDSVRALGYEIASALGRAVNAAKGIGNTPEKPVQVSDVSSNQVPEENHGYKKGDWISLSSFSDHNSGFVTAAGPAFAGANGEFIQDVYIDGDFPDSKTPYLIIFTIDNGKKREISFLMPGFLILGKNKDAYSSNAFRDKAIGDNGDIFALVEAKNEYGKSAPFLVAFYKENHRLFVNHFINLANSGNPKDSRFYSNNFWVDKEGNIVVSIQFVNENGVNENILRVIKKPSSEGFQILVTKSLNPLDLPGEGLNPHATVMSTGLTSDGRVSQIIDRDLGGESALYEVIYEQFSYDDPNPSVKVESFRQLDSDVTENPLPAGVPSPEGGELVNGVSGIVQTMGKALLNILVPQHERVLNAVQGISPTNGGDMIEESLSINDRGGMGAVNTPAAQAPPVTNSVDSVISILEEGLQPLIDLQAIRQALSPTSPSDHDSSGLLQTLLDAVSAQVQKPAVAPEKSTKPGTVTRESLWEEVRQFIEAKKEAAKELGMRTLEFHRGSETPNEYYMEIINENFSPSASVPVKSYTVGTFSPHRPLNDLDGFLAWAEPKNLQTGSVAETELYTNKESLRAELAVMMEHVQEEMLRILIRKGKVELDGEHGDFVWGDVGQISISRTDMRNLAACVLHQKDGSTRHVVFDLKTMEADSVKGVVFPEVSLDGNDYTNLGPVVIQDDEDLGPVLISVMTVKTDDWDLNPNIIEMNTHLDLRKGDYQERLFSDISMQIDGRVPLKYYPFLGSRILLFKNGNGRKEVSVYNSKLNRCDTYDIATVHRLEGTIPSDVYSQLLEELSQNGEEIEGRSGVGGTVLAQINEFVERILAAVNNVDSPADKGKSTEALPNQGNAGLSPAAQTMATRVGWNALVRGVESLFGALPGWFPLVLNEADYTALREMGKYWGVPLLLSAVVGLFSLPMPVAGLLVVLGLLNAGSFHRDHAQGGQDLGWFPFTWKMGYALAVFSFAVGDAYLLGSGMVLFTLIRHVLYDAPRFADRDRLLKDSLEALEDLPGVTLTMPSVQDELIAVRQKFTPQVVTFSAKDSLFGSSVLNVLLGRDSAASLPSGEKAGLELIGHRMSGVGERGRRGIYEQYEGALAVQSADWAVAETSPDSAGVWGRALAPVMALRNALGLKGVPTRAILGLLFRELVLTAKQNPSQFPANKNQDTTHPIVGDISLLLDSSANPLLKTKMIDRLRLLGQQKEQVVFITANQGSLRDIERVWEENELPVTPKVIFIDPRAIATGGLIDGVVLTHTIFRQSRDLFSIEESPEDIQLNFVTDNIDRFVGLSPRQIAEVILVTINGLIEISRRDIKNILTVARAVVTSA